MTEDEIKKLFFQAKTGDRDAFGYIYKEYFTPIYRYLYFRLKDKNTTDDLVQEVFLRAFRNLPNINFENKNPLAYFYIIAKNLLIDSYRKVSTPIVSDEEAEEILIDDETPQIQYEREEEIHKLRRALQKISETEAEAIILKYIKNHSNKEISEIMGKSEEAVRQLQSRGLKSLRKLYENI